MIKDIWHTEEKIPCGDQYVVVKHLSGQYSVGPVFEYDGGHYEKWAYFDDLLTLESELERTRKALDVATGFIKGISKTVINDCDNQYVVLGNFKKFAQDTLEKITALEQKD